MSSPARITLSQLASRCRQAGVPFSRATFYRRYRKDAEWLKRLDAQQGAVDITFDELAALAWILEQQSASLLALRGNRVGERSPRAQRFFRDCGECGHEMHVRSPRCGACGARRECQP